MQLLEDTSEIKGEESSVTIPYDYLVYAVGAETQTFNIPGVKEYGCFMKEMKDAEKVYSFYLITSISFDRFLILF